MRPPRHEGTWRSTSRVPIPQGSQQPVRHRVAPLTPGDLGRAHRPDETRVSDGSLRRDGRSNGSTVLGVERAALDASLGILEQLVEVGAIEVRVPAGVTRGRHDLRRGTGAS